MRRRILTLLAAAATATAFAVPAVAEDGSRMGTFEVTITNLAATQPISPPVVVSHDYGTHFFERGSAASSGIIAIAEDGDPSVAVDALSGAPFVTDVVNVGQPLTLAGTTFGDFSDSVTIQIEAQRNDVVSVAGMLICTNDGFAGGDSLALPRFGRPATYYLNGYDAGSEYNTEQSEDIVDACSLLGPVVLDGDDNGNNNAGIDTHRRILPHRGIAGIGDLLLAHNWDNPVVVVTISRVG
jgi:hypothetical protein